VLDLEGLLVTRESQEHIRRILSDLPQRDQQLLRAVFLEEKDKDEVCRSFGVDRGLPESVAPPCKGQIQVALSQRSGCHA